MPLLVGLAWFAAQMIVLEGPGLTGWVRRWTEPRDEWILSLGEEDLAVLSDGASEDMFWRRYRLTALHPVYVSRLMDAASWNEGRFSYRHRLSGRRVTSLLAGWQEGRPLETDDGLRVVVRWFS